MTGRSQRGARPFGVTMGLTVAAVIALAGRASVGAETLRRRAELGPVKALVDLEPAEPLIGDPVTLRLTVVAEKGVEVLMPEFGEALEAFAILDFAPRQSVDDRGRTMSVQTYRLQPLRSGSQAIPPILIEFVDRRPGQKASPEGEDAYELLTERIEFTVKSVLPKDAQAELKPPRGALAPLAPPAPPRWPWIVGIAILAAIAAPLVARGFAAWRRRRRRRSAYQIARARLERLLAAPLPEGDRVDAFYVELSGIVRQYLEYRFELRAPELTTEEFLELAGDSSDLADAHQRLLRDFLKQSDLVKFAGARPPREVVEGSLRAAERFLEETRDSAPRWDVDELPNGPPRPVAAGSPSSGETP